MNKPEKEEMYNKFVKLNQDAMFSLQEGNLDKCFASLKIAEDIVKSQK